MNHVQSRPTACADWSMDFLRLSWCEPPFVLQRLMEEDELQQRQLPGRQSVAIQMSA